MIERENPDKIITIGGNCIVSLAPFDYLHGKYGDTGIIWLDAHPDVSTPQDGYAYAHAMVLGKAVDFIILTGFAQNRFLGRADDRIRPARET